ncbi:MAG: fasciclin domain-containing protein [Phenylobacterium sp.]|uniref:fasciclin domain-containing protein n=1 Tax=Phenylobacterium sp. TaxID=1871053 RepID=UPI001A3E915D|nr:fasciclin domain-containing protein [Phenylobacterium sp.]MBL8554204.1 fasciclin domain-containing protein [Phenylobacterium sp.]
MTTRLLLAAVALAAAPFAAQAQTPAPAAPAPAAAPTAGAAKPVTVNGDLVDTLKLNGGFTIFTKGLTDTNLAGLLKTNANLTVFAPTDSAFQAMPAADLARLQADKAAMQKFILHHIVNAPVASTKIKGAKGPIPSGAGDTILLDGSDEGGVMKVDGATIVQADVKTGSGLLHVVDHVLIAGQGNADPVAPAAPPPAADASATAKQ